MASTYGSFSQLAGWAYGCAWYVLCSPFNQVFLYLFVTLQCNAPPIKPGGWLFCLSRFFYYYICLPYPNLFSDIVFFSSRLHCLFYVSASILVSTLYVFFSSFPSSCSPTLHSIQQFFFDQLYGLSKRIYIIFFIVPVSANVRALGTFSTLFFICRGKMEGTEDRMPRKIAFVLRGLNSFPTPTDPPFFWRPFSFLFFSSIEQELCVVLTLSSPPPPTPFVVDALASVETFAFITPRSFS